MHQQVRAIVDMDLIQSLLPLVDKQRASTQLWVGAIRMVCDDGTGGLRGVVVDNEGLVGHVVVRVLKRRLHIGWGCVFVLYLLCNFYVMLNVNIWLQLVLKKMCTHTCDLNWTEGYFYEFNIQRVTWELNISWSITNNMIRGRCIANFNLYVALNACIPNSCKIRDYMTKKT